jgi:hypothetical protein
MLFPLTYPIRNVQNWSSDGVISHAKTEANKPLESYLLLLLLGSTWLSFLVLVSYRLRVRPNIKGTHYHTMNTVAYRISVQYIIYECMVLEESSILHTRCAFTQSVTVLL